MIKYITSLSYISAALLGRVLIYPAESLAVQGSLYLPFNALALATLAKLEVSETLTDGESIYTSKLTAPLCKPFLIPRQPIALRLDLTDGTRLLLGTASRPYPLTTLALTHPDQPADQSAQTLTVEWQSPLPPLTLLEDKA